MGVSVNAYLGYGVHLSYEQLENLPWAAYQDDDDRIEGEASVPREPRLSFEDWVTQLAGLVDPSTHIVDRNDEWEGWYAIPINREAMGAYWRQQTEAKENFPIGVIDVYTGDSGDPCIILAVKSTISSGRWGEPRPAVTTLDEAALQEAVDLCSKHRIPFESPQWLLVAEYAG